MLALGGATEAAIWSNCFTVTDTVTDTVTESKQHWSSIPYGTPLANQQFYILQPDSRLLCPPGVTGELCIGGAGLAQGYLGDPQKTASAFIEHPDYGHLYRTGDLGHLDGEGLLVFEGREDTQVKIHGHRVELGEIEYALEQLPWIDQAAVTCQQETLVGFLVVDQQMLPGPDQQPGQAEIRDKAERIDFKMARHGVRHIRKDDTIIPLSSASNDRFRFCPAWSADASEPLAISDITPLSLDRFSALLAGLRSYSGRQYSATQIRLSVRWQPLPRATGSAYRFRCH